MFRKDTLFSAYTGLFKKRTGVVEPKPCALRIICVHRSEKAILFAASRYHAGSLSTRKVSIYMIDIIEHGPVKELRLNRPPVNALDVPFIEALSTAIQVESENAHALVLSGRPGLFSAGLDVPSLLQLDRPGTEHFVRSFFGLMEMIARSPIPIASAITGHCPAGGTVLVLFTDYRVMSRGKYVMGLNEVQVGLSVPVPIFEALARCVGRQRAERLTVAGLLISPEQGHEAGLIDHLEDDAEATVQAAVDWCTHMATALPQPAMLATRNIARSDLAALFDNFGDEDIHQFVEGWYAPHTQAGLNGLVEQLRKKQK